MDDLNTLYTMVQNSQIYTCNYDYDLTQFSIEITNLSNEVDKLIQYIDNIISTYSSNTVLNDSNLISSINKKFYIWYISIFT